MLGSVLVLFVLSLIGTGLYRQYALKHQIMDVPTHRSAHDLPIPRGGGVVFVALFLCAMAYEQHTSMGVILSVFGVALLGYLDDKHALTAGTRLSGHLVFGITALISMGGMPDLHVGPWLWQCNIWTSIFGVFYLVWMLNLYNFMDGINGIAGLEAICAAVGIAILYGALHAPETMGLPLMLAAVVGGFLVWNFPKAKLFMGDAGSGFLGFLFGMWSLQSAHTHPQLFWSWLILLGVFVVDSTVTLLWRMARKEPLHVAHASHAYQHASRRRQSHTQITLAVVAINVLWLWPMAIAVGLGYLNSLLGVLIAYFPLIMLVSFLKAGRCS